MFLKEQEKHAIVFSLRERPGGADENEIEKVIEKAETIRCMQILLDLTLEGFIEIDQISQIRLERVEG